MPMAAQETYENAKLTGDDLNGTARYVGMGGAMEALGADISTIGTNPAGLGLFRHSTLSGSGSLIMQSGANGAKGDKTTASFDQLGFVYSVRTGRSSYVNIAYNYHKSKNFNFILAATNRLNGASQNKQTSQKWYNGAFSANDDNYSTVDAFYINNFLGRTVTDDDGNETTVFDNWVDANGFQLNREHEGWIADHDFSVSANLSDRVYLGLTLGIKDVNYKHYGEYGESLVDGSTINITDDRRVDGTGVNVKFGTIIRPVEESPFRVGLYVHTPTWYDLTTENTTRYYDSTNGIANATDASRESYDFKINTPWVFGVSLGHTVGNFLALGATYEYADYSATKTRIIDRAWYGYYGDYYEDSSNDRAMNKHTEDCIKGVHTLKVGAEFKPLPELALRVGYNYVSPKFDTKGEKATYEYSQDYRAERPVGTYYTSTTDFTNWKGTNRFTCGIGYQMNRWNFDLAYQLSTQKGDFRPFGTYIETEAGAGGVVDHTQDNIPSVTSVKNNRSQVLLTVGYHF